MTVTVLRVTRRSCRVRLLRAEDEPAAVRFLETHRDSALIMLSNLAKAGLGGGTTSYQGAYAAHLHGRDISALAAHYGNGWLLLQAPEGAAPLAALALSASGRPLTSLLGSSEQVAAVRRELGLHDCLCSLDSNEDVMALALPDLILPAAIGNSEFRVRLARSSELELLANWRLAFVEEALRVKDSPALRARVRDEIAGWQAEKANFVLACRGRLVASCAVIADYGETLQVAAVWTPAALRGRGFARCLIAGVMARARDRGTQRALLITSNPAARRAYRAVGFQKVGQQSLVQFVEPLRLRLPRPKASSLARRLPQDTALANSRGAA